MGIMGFEHQLLNIDFKCILVAIRICRNLLSDSFESREEIDGRLLIGCWR
jgi:hypothetical protein